MKENQTIMKKNQTLMDGYKQRNWEAIGALHGVPEERKPTVIELLDKTLDYVNTIIIDIVGPKTKLSDRENVNDKTITAEQRKQAVILLFPIITRISSHLDLTFNDVRNIYANVEFGVFDFNEKNLELSVLNVDLEGIFVAHFCDEYVAVRQKKPVVIPDCDEVRDIKHLTEKRDDEMRHLKDIVEMNFSDKIAREKLNDVLKLNKQLKTLEDALIVSGVTSEKKVFNIEVGNIPEDEIEDYVKNTIRKFKKDIPLGDTPLPDIKFPDEDIFLPIKGDEDLT